MKKIIGFIFADDMEFKPFSEFALSGGGEEVAKRPQNVVRLSAEHADIYACESGIGKVNAAAAAVELIRTYKADCILSAGLSGAVSGLKQGDVAVGTSYVECDFDISSIGYKRGEKPGGERIYDAPKDLVDAALKIDGMKSGRLGTGDFFLADTEKKNDYKNEFDIKAFDMESAAIAAVCKKYEVPFMSVRKISDDADDTAGVDYRQINNLCEETLTEILMQIVDNLEF